MANYASLKTAIQQVVKTNGNNEITGALLQQTLFAMVNSLGADYQFAGIAVSSTNPGTPDQRVFYLAGSGTYPNFNNAIIQDGYIGVLKFNGTWVVESVPVGKNYDDEINDLKLHAGIAKYAIQSNGFQSGRYWYPQGGTVAHLDNSGTLAGTVKAIPVKPGDQLYFNVVQSGSVYGIVLANDSDTVIISYNKANTDRLGGVLTIPNGVSRAYFNTLQTEIQNSYVVYGVLFVDELNRQIEGINNCLFVEQTFNIQVGKGVAANNGEIVNASGNNTVVIDLSQTKARFIKFTQTTSSSYGYGFMVNGVWQGYNNTSFPSGLNYYERTVQVPDGATEFRFSWNTNLYPNTNHIYCVLPDALEQAYAAIGQISSIESALSILDNAVFKERIVDIGDGVSTGGILLDGTFDTNATFGRVEIALDGNVTYRDFIFKQTFVNNATRCCYGFVVNGQWVGYPGLASTTTPTEITVPVPEGATIFRVSWNRNQIQDGDFVLKAMATADNGSNDINNKPIFQFFPDFVLSRVPTYQSPTEAQAVNFKPADLYALYDGLVAANPGYITKIDCDAEAQAALGITAPSYMSGLHIYMYKFSPKIGGNSTGTDQTSRVKVFITSMHPQEKFGTYATFYLAKMICENWKNDINAEILRSLVDIYILPCPWVWNMQNGSRTNYNGINGNRQFPTKNWQESGVGTSNWSGSSPLSEYEAKVINYFFLQIKPNVSMDVHTSGNDNVGHMGIFLVNSADKQLVDLCGIIAKTTSNQAVKDNPNFPESAAESVYGVYPEDGSQLGEFYEYAYEQGCKFSILSEESPYSKWNNGVYENDGPIIEQYTDGILREQIQYLYNTLLRLTRQACVVYYQ